MLTQSPKRPLILRKVFHLGKNKNKTLLFKLIGIILIGLIIVNQIKQSITRHPFCSFPAVLMPIKTLADHNPWRSRVKLFIGNLPYDITEPEVLELFSTYGEVVNASLVIDHFSGRSKGFAFVEMATRSEGHRAMETLNKKEYRHRQLVCNEAKPQKKGKRRR